MGLIKGTPNHNTAQRKLPRNDGPKSVLGLAGQRSRSASQRASHGQISPSHSHREPFFLPASQSFITSLSPPRLNLQRTRTFNQNTISQSLTHEIFIHTIIQSYNHTITQLRNHTLTQNLHSHNLTHIHTHKTSINQTHNLQSHNQIDSIFQSLAPTLSLRALPAKLRHSLSETFKANSSHLQIERNVGDLRLISLQILQIIHHGIRQTKQLQPGSIRSHMGTCCQRMDDQQTGIQQRSRPRVTPDLP